MRRLPSPGSQGRPDPRQRQMRGPLRLRHGGCCRRRSHRPPWSSVPLHLPTPAAPTSPLFPLPVSSAPRQKLPKPQYNPSLLFRVYQLRNRKLEPMESHRLPFIILLIAASINPSHSSAAPATPCRSNCGSLQIKYPFGTGYGCGSPRFEPYVTCNSNQLVLTTHTGSYPIADISYRDSTVTVTPSAMSTCSSMQQSPNLGLDWASPFQLGPSIFLLLSCSPPTSSLTIKGSPVCDPSSAHLCATIYTCPAVVNLGLPLFPPTNTCCVYSPANFNTKGELDLREMKCKGYTSIASLEDSPTDPSKWLYGVTLKYTSGGFDDYYMNNKCNTCEDSGGICGYSPPSNSFLCICNSGFNTSTDCYNNYNPVQDYEDALGSSTSLSTWKIWLGLWVGLILCITA